MYRIVLFSLLVFLGSSCQLSTKPQGQARPSSVQVGQAHYTVEVRITNEERRQGLSDREVLETNTGMLFLFDQAEIRNFWMKDMRFPLDFIWIKNKKVVGISQNIPHPAINNGEIARISSPEPADAVLEVNAGQIDEYGINVGDLVIYE